ncbi:MAG: dTDP-4-amino-4,6-dideoxygalactose transaminase [Mariprofundaceae bacterium]|nr:dTDP-4-amino-4,6-dideoxygalactose transaminase [Mariprofundaceae bacterium]
MTDLSEEMIPFNKPFMTGDEVGYMLEAHANGHLSGNGPFTHRCHAWLEEHTGCKKALLTHSCTAALEMAAMLIDLKHGDEVIMPSYTFVSTANAFVLRGAVPVFVDIREDTLNMDETLIEDAITERTRAICVVHYAGVACEMDSIMEIADRHGLFVIEDAAQGVMAEYKGRPLGSIGHLAAYSFHETKNIISGEGGALLINDACFVERGEVLWEKGTDRSRFFRGEVDKYRWVDIGSSFLPSELIAAFLWAQLQHADTITSRRLELWQRYHRAFAVIEAGGTLRLPRIPDDCGHNAHMYYLLFPDEQGRSAFISAMKDAGVHTVFHYIPLHLSPAGKRFGRISGSLSVTCSLANRLVRLPLWVGIEGQQDKVIETVLKYMG